MYYICVLPPSADIPDSQAWVMQHLDDPFDPYAKQWGALADPTTKPALLTEEQADYIRTDKGFTNYLLLPCTLTDWP
jgi:hypothetical protein